MRKLINNTLLVEVPKKIFSDLLLEQKYFYNLKIKAYPPQLHALIKGCCEKPRSLPLHFRRNKN